MRTFDVSSPPTNGPVVRIRHSEIIPVEMGDLYVDGSVFVEHIRQWGLGSTLRKAIETLHAGRGATRSNGPLAPVVSQFVAVLLTGGRAKEEELGAELSQLTPRVLFGANGAFTGVAGGFELLRMQGLSGWVLDLGQSWLKMTDGKQFWSFPRDFIRLSGRVDMSPPKILRQRRRLCEFIALKLQIAMAETGRRPEAVLFALPTRLDDDGTPGTGDYAGLRGYRELIPDALLLAGLAHVPSFVLNDAELAAFSARADPRLAAFHKILVLTLGFGIGAALVCRSG